MARKNKSKGLGTLGTFFLALFVLAVVAHELSATVAFMIAALAAVWRFKTTHSPEPRLNESKREVEPDIEDWRSLRTRADWDRARLRLQKMSYGMVDSRMAGRTKAEFKQAMTEFAAADPLVKEILLDVKPLILSTPGQPQSKIYRELPDFTEEEVRYALYFAHELGWISRKKKGNTYQLFPAKEVIDV